MGANVKGQIELVVKNLRATLDNKTTTPLGSPMAAFPSLVTLGPTYLSIILIFIYILNSYIIFIK